MRNEYLACEKHYNLQYAKGYALYLAVKDYFAECDCKSPLALTCLYLNYVEMKPKKLVEVTSEINRVLSRCQLGDLTGLKADVYIHKGHMSLTLGFDTGGFGLVKADITKSGKLTVVRT